MPTIIKPIPTIRNTDSGKANIRIKFRLKLEGLKKGINPSKTNNNPKADSKSDQSIDMPTIASET